MSNQTTNSNSVNESQVLTVSRVGGCQHHTRKGRCRMPISDPSAAFCAEHAQRQQKKDKAAALSAELTAGLTEFKSAVPINDFLSRLLLFQAQDRIPPRGAAVMAYTCNLLLRTLPAIQHETNPESDDGPTIIWDVPRPKRD